MVHNKRMIERAIDLKLVEAALKRSRVVALLGPRQCGKTTLARRFVAADSLNYFDLEDPLSLARLSEPEIALRPLKGLVVIDEVSVILHGKNRNQFSCVASAIRSDFFGARLGTVGCNDSCGRVAPILEYARSLPRSSLECRRTGACTNSK